MFHFYTIADGERAAIWDIGGRRELVTGPKRLLLFRKRAILLKAFVAGPAQYLVIEHRDGRVVHERGPVSVWMDPVEHASIHMAEAISLDANEAVVVYRQEQSKIARRIMRGPELFVPDPSEWLHKFSWHGATPADPRHKAPGALNFTKLRVIPDQMYFDVEDVRTADDALLVVKLMIFFELRNIETMLNETHDPIADFINAVSADVIDMASQLSFDEFKEQTKRLGDLNTYTQLTQRAERIGYGINKVVYRGYHASSKLQAMHDNAIETRTRLHLETETEQQVQALADLKLTRDQERSRQRREMEQAEAEHQLLLKKTAHAEQLRQLQADRELELSGRKSSNDEEIRQMRAKHEARLAARKAANELAILRELEHNREQAEFFRLLGGMQVDLTRYLVAQYQNPDRLIRIEGGRDSRVHLHEEQ
ncbi:MAG TPA: hypothetical protein VMG59_01200 [Phycisphaerae bacterium]|nr:hypothetical protein [Phycisphaerae bacterium]